MFCRPLTPPACVVKSFRPDFAGSSDNVGGGMTTGAVGLVSMTLSMLKISELVWSAPDHMLTKNPTTSFKYCQEGLIGMLTCVQLVAVRGIVKAGGAMRLSQLALVVNPTTRLP